DRHLAHLRGLKTIRLLPVGRGAAIQQAHLPVDPGPGAYAGEQSGLGERSDVIVQPAIVQLLTRSKTAGNEKGIHGRLIGEGVVRQYGEARLRLHRTERIRDQERFQFRVETPRDLEHAVRSCEVDDLYILEDVYPKPETGLLRIAAMFHENHLFARVSPRSSAFSAS